MVADAVVYHPSVAHFNRFVATTVGRDKALRLVQYFSRFLAWYLYRTNHPQTTIAPFEAAKKTFGSVRKAMRLGKFIEHLKAAAVAADAKNMDPVLRYLAIGRQLGYAAYLSLDNIYYLHSTGIRKFEGGDKLQKQAYKAWWTGLACNILAGVYTLYKVQAMQKKVASEGDAEKKVEEKKLEKERAATQLQLLSDCCDIVVPSSATGLVTLDDGIVGLAGTVSSLIGLRSAWAKTA